VGGEFQDHVAVSWQLTKLGKQVHFCLWTPKFQSQKNMAKRTHTYLFYKRHQIRKECVGLTLLCFGVVSLLCSVSVLIISKLKIALFELLHGETFSFFFS
jgi:hypothetical protein